MGGRRPLGPTPRAAALYLGTGLSGGGPGEPGGWCGADRGRLSPLLLGACRAAIYPGARARARPLPEYWAIGPATRSPGAATLCTRGAALLRPPQGGREQPPPPGSTSSSSLGSYSQCFYPPLSLLCGAPWPV